MFVRMENMNERVGARVRSLRAGRDWTQGDLAKRMATAGYPMHQTTVAKMESGARPTTVNEVAALAFIFGVPPSALLSDDDVNDLVNVRVAILFEHWEMMRQEAVKAHARADESFQQLATFVQSNHTDALAAFFGRARQWAEVEGASPEEVDALHSTLVALAVPVKPFKDKENEAWRVLADEREARPDGQHQET